VCVCVCVAELIILYQDIRAYGHA